MYSATTFDPMGQNVTVHQLCHGMQTYCLYRTVVDVLILLPVIIVGIIGNTLAIFVLKTDCLQGSVSFLLQALAVSDNMYLVSSLFIQTIKTLTECTSLMSEHLQIIEAYMLTAVWPLASTAQTCCTWIILTVTVDRYCSIHRPFHRTWRFAHSKHRQFTVILAVAALVYNTPRFLEHRTDQVWNHCQLDYFYTSTKTNFSMNPMYYMIYKIIMYLIFRMVVPLAIIGILNIRLIMTLRDAKICRMRLEPTFSNRTSNSKTGTATLLLSNYNQAKHSSTIHNSVKRQTNTVFNQANRTKFSKSQNSNEGFTIILIAMISVFMLCSIPDALLRIMVMLHRTFGMAYPSNLHYINTASNALLTLNSSINCLIYGLTGRRYRKVLNCMLKRWSRRFLRRNSEGSSNACQQQQYMLNNRVR